MRGWHTFLIGLLGLSGWLGFASRAVAHGGGHSHLATEHAFPLAELFSGVALLLAAGSLWMSWRTRRLLDDHISANSHSGE